MKKLFILFQGSGTNSKSWNEYTDSKFLDKLKEIGHVFVYQDKVHNIWRYDKTNPERKDFPKDLSAIDLSYINLLSHVHTVFEMVSKKFPTLEENYEIVTIGWSAGCYLAIYFAEIYKHLVRLTVCLDSALFTPDEMRLRLETLRTDKAGMTYPLTDQSVKKLLRDIQRKKENDDALYHFNNSMNYQRSLDFFQFMNTKRFLFSVPVLYFVNVQNPEKDEWSKDFNNETRLNQVKFLHRLNNATMFQYFILTNKTHMIFNKKQPCQFIISKIAEKI
jgi:pimeloyl-ACP methyl ester carboxylesterase